jgi:hypothetical protein
MTRNAMTTKTQGKAVLLISMLALLPRSARAAERPDGMRFVPDVPGQFRALTKYADPLGFHRDGSPDPSKCKHYQAITRVDGADGTPFFLVTRSGNDPDDVPDDLCDDSSGETDNGHLVVFRMGSRDKNGERLRSNRLRRGDLFGKPDFSPPRPEDKATIYFTVVGGDPADPDPAKRPGLVFRDGEGTQPPRVYQHPGGMQLVGHILAMAVETPRAIGSDVDCTACLVDPGSDACRRCLHYERAPHETAILFFDVRNPEDPLFKSQFAPRHANGSPLEKSGVVAVTPLPGGRYLMAITGGKNEGAVFFYRSTLDDLSRPDLSWELVDSTPGPDVEDAHQTLQFLRNGDIHGDKFLAGARGSVLFDDRDRIDLYLVQCDTEDCAPGEQVRLTTTWHGQEIQPLPSVGGFRLANLAAATGFYVSPSGELIFYATEHENTGPVGTVSAGEWRHLDVVRKDSPTLLPHAVLNVPFEVPEGRDTELRGRAEPPLTKPWIQLFWQTEFRHLYPVVDFDDYALDDFDDFNNLLGFELLDPLVTHADKARSWNYFAPVGCSILATDHEDGEVNETKTLAGTGLTVPDPDLRQVLNDRSTDDIDQEIDAVAFRDDCNDYYNAEVGLLWDLDRDGSYEATGPVVPFDAHGLDGPDVVDVPVRAQHPFGGPPGETIAAVTVRNVAPELTPLGLTDSAGNEVSVDVPFVLVGLPLTVSAGFADPGLPDRQTATLAWGDGALDAQGAFTIFDEAFGDGTGGATHKHRYARAGTFGIELSVTDDDGGVGRASAVVDVRTAEQAVEEVIALLDALIAGTVDAEVRKELERARKALAGNPNGENGALDKIRDGEGGAAIAFLQEAISRLQRAGALGTDVATLIALLEQVIASLSAA